MTDGRLQLALVGLGYWGPNLARNFAAIDGCDLAWCCDASEEARARFAGQYPRTRFTDNLDDVLADPALDAVAIATPVPTHAELAVRLLDRELDPARNVRPGIDDHGLGAEFSVRVRRGLEAHRAARHLIEQNGVRVDGKAVSDTKTVMDFETAVIQVGKRKFVKATRE